MNATSFPVLEWKPTDLNSFINYWSTYYNYKPEYENSYYHEPIAFPTLTADGLEKLYIWKNGSVLSAKKQQSFKTKICSRLIELNELKMRGVQSIEDVIQVCPDVSAIWLIFLAHILAKETFPIFDMHVFRAYHFLTTNQIKEIPDHNGSKVEWYNKYLSYYRLHQHPSSNYKKWDEAMWAFGKFLSRYKANQL